MKENKFLKRNLGGEFVIYESVCEWFLWMRICQKLGKGERNEKKDSFIFVREKIIYFYGVVWLIIFIFIFYNSIITTSEERKLNLNYKCS